MRILGGNLLKPGIVVRKWIDEMLIVQDFVVDILLLLLLLFF